MIDVLTVNYEGEQIVGPRTVVLPTYSQLIMRVNKIIVGPRGGCVTDVLTVDYEGDADICSPLRVRCLTGVAPRIVTRHIRHIDDSSVHYKVRHADIPLTLPTGADPHAVLVPRVRNGLRVARRRQVQQLRVALRDAHSAHGIKTKHWLV